MGMEMSVFLTYIGAILLIFIFGKLFLWPLKMILKLIINSVIGGVVIVIINAVGANLGLLIPLNMINALIVGVLGLPGAILLLLMSL